VTPRPPESFDDEPVTVMAQLRAALPRARALEALFREADTSEWVQS